MSWLNIKQAACLGFFLILFLSWTSCLQHSHLSLSLSSFPCSSINCLLLFDLLRDNWAKWKPNWFQHDHSDHPLLKQVAMKAWLWLHCPQQPQSDNVGSWLLVRCNKSDITSTFHWEQWRGTCALIICLRLRSKPHWVSWNLLPNKWTIGWLGMGL